MAEEEAKTTKEKKSKKSSGNLVLIILIVLIILLVAIFGLVAYLALFASDDNADEQITDSNDPKAVSEQKAPKKGQESLGEIGIMFPLEAFTANLLSESGSRYLKCTMELEQNIPELTPEIESKKAVIRDIVLRALSSKTYEEISTDKGKERLKDEIKDKINRRLNDGFIKNIYFTDFVISS